MKWRANTAALLWLVAFMKFSALGLFLLPAWSVADEPGHYSYVMEFARGNFTPVHGVTRFDQDALKSQHGRTSKRPNYILSHPPLYYLALSPVGFVADQFTDDPVIILRAQRVFNAAIGAVGVLFIFLAALRLGLSKPAAWFAAIVPLATPNLGILSGGVTNDVGVFTLAAVGGYFLIAYLQHRRPRDEAICLAAFMASALCKSTGLPLFVGMVGYFGIMRIVEKRLTLRWICVLLALVVPLFLWHLNSYLVYGSWVRLGSLRSKRILSPAAFTFWDFVRTSPVVDAFLSSYLGHVWIRRGILQLVLIRLPDGLLLQVYILMIGGLITITGAVMAFSGRFSSPSVSYRAMSLTCSLVLALAAAYLVASKAFAAPLVTGGLTFLGVYGLFNVREMFRAPAAGFRFTLLTFAAFFFMVLVALYNIYQVELIYGVPKATHGRYFFALAPLFLVSIAFVLDNNFGRRFLFPLFVVSCIAVESFYWHSAVFPIHTVFKGLAG